MVIRNSSARSGSARGAAKPATAPARHRSAAAPREVEPKSFMFADDGAIPNNPDLPLLIYAAVVEAGGADGRAAVFEDLFRTNGWGDCWRNGIYDYVHYHSRIHEALGIARGRARVRFGGDRGAEIDVAAGDVAVLPAGIGHHCVMASADFLVVGAYPPSGTYDECRGRPGEHARALQTVAAVAMPDRDPVFGVNGPLRRLWKRQIASE